MTKKAGKGSTKKPRSNGVFITDGKTMAYAPKSFWLKLRTHPMIAKMNVSHETIEAGA